MGNYFSKAGLVQAVWIPNPTLTEENLPDQTGKVHIVTGGYAGVGEQLSQILYSKGAKVYIAGRNASKCEAAVQRIKSAVPNSTGQLIFLEVDFSDLPSIKPAVEEYLSKESRLDVLVNNAGVMLPPAGSKTKQGHELQIGTNCLGAHLLTKLLHPILKKTAASSAPNSVRVIWAASTGIQFSPPGGMTYDSDNKVKDIDRATNYAQSKVGNLFLAIETQQILKNDGIVSVSFNPGNLKTELGRHFFGIALISWMLYPAIYGAYTELWSGWSQDVTIDKGISYVMPWGQDGTYLVRQDIMDAIEKQDAVEKFWQYCEEETRAYA